MLCNVVYNDETLGRLLCAQITIYEHSFLQNELT